VRAGAGRNRFLAGVAVGGAFDDTSLKQFAGALFEAADAEYCSEELKHSSQTRRAARGRRRGGKLCSAWHRVL